MCQTKQYPYSKPNPFQCTNLKPKAQTNISFLINTHTHTRRETKKERNILCGPIAPLPLLALLDSLLWTKLNIEITSKIFGCLKGWNLSYIHFFLSLSLSIMDSQCMPSSPSLHPKIHRNAKLNPSWEAIHLRKRTICFKSRMYDTCKTPSSYFLYIGSITFNFIVIFGLMTSISSWQQLLHLLLPP